MGHASSSCACSKIDDVRVFTSRALYPFPEFLEPGFPHISAIQTSVAVPGKPVTPALYLDCATVDNGVGNLAVSAFQYSRACSTRNSQLTGGLRVIHSLVVNQPQRLVFIEQKHNLAELRRRYSDGPEQHHRRWNPDETFFLRFRHSKSIRE